MATTAVYTHVLLADIALPSPQHYCSAAQPTHRPTRRIRLSLRASGQRPTRKPARCRASWQRRWRPSRPRAKRSNRAGRVGQQHRGEHKPYTPSWGSGRHPPPGPLFCAHRVAAQRGHKSHSLPVPKRIQPVEKCLRWPPRAVRTMLPSGTDLIAGGSRWVQGRCLR